MLYELPALRDDSWNEDEPVSGVRIDASPGKPDFFDASPGKPDCFVTLVSHRHRRVLLCPPPRRTYGGPGTLRLRCVVCVMAALATRSSSSTAASSSSTATSQQQQQLKLLLQQQLCCTL